MDQLQSEPSHTLHHVLQINDSMRLIGLHYPTLMLQWCNILILLNYDDQSWWRFILRTNDRKATR